MSATREQGKIKGLGNLSYCNSRYSSKVFVGLNLCTGLGGIAGTF